MHLDIPGHPLHLNDFSILVLLWNVHGECLKNKKKDIRERIKEIGVSIAAIVETKLKKANELVLPLEC